MLRKITFGDELADLDLFNGKIRKDRPCVDAHKLTFVQVPSLRSIKFHSFVLGQKKIAAFLLRHSRIKAIRLDGVLLRQDDEEDDLFETMRKLPRLSKLNMTFYQENGTYSTVAADYDQTDPNEERERLHALKVLKSNILHGEPWSYETDDMITEMLD